MASLHCPHNMLEVPSELDDEWSQPVVSASTGQLGLALEEEGYDMSVSHRSPAAYKPCPSLKPAKRFQVKPKPKEIANKLKDLFLAH
jgi:hypothetical protein